MRPDERRAGAAGGGGTGTLAGVVLLLSVATGATDAVTFLSGKVFASVVTGNLVLLGVSAGQRQATLAARAGVAFLGYGLGTAAGRRVRPADDPHEWATRAARALTLELALLAVTAAAWETRADAGWVELALIASASAAMGVQSWVGRTMPGERPSTTYFTGLVTTVLGTLSRSGNLSGQALALVALGGLVAGAAGAAALALAAPRAAPAVALAALTASIALVATAVRRGRRRPPTNRDVSRRSAARRRS